MVATWAQVVGKFTLDPQRFFPGGLVSSRGTLTAQRGDGLVFPKGSLRINERKEPSVDGRTKGMDMSGLQSVRTLSVGRSAFRRLEEGRDHQSEVSVKWCGDGRSKFRGGEGGGLDLYRSVIW